MKVLFTSIDHPSKRRKELEVSTVQLPLDDAPGVRITIGDVDLGTSGAVLHPDEARDMAEMLLAAADEVEGRGGDR